MNVIFISYGDDNFKESLKRIGKEAKKLNLFDKIILYTPKDLPQHIKASPLMAFSKGGGYWLWKSYIIWKTLQSYGNDAIVIYVDSGCTLNKSDMWQAYLEQIKFTDTILFKYKDNTIYEGWKELFNCESPQIQHWTKRKTLLYFDELFKTKEWREYNKIMGGFIIAKNKENVFINEWLKISLFHPELIVDPVGEELSNQFDNFKVHRHDQCIITPLAYYFEQTKNVLVLDETAETKVEKVSAVVATRKRDEYKPKVSLKTKIIRTVKLIIGEKIYKFIHG